MGDICVSSPLLAFSHTQSQSCKGTFIVVAIEKLHREIRRRQDRRVRTSSRDGRVEESPRLNSSKSGDSGDSLAALFGKHGELVSASASASASRCRRGLGSATYGGSGYGVEHLGWLWAGAQWTRREERRAEVVSWVDGGGG